MLYFAYVDLEKAFGRILQEVVWWAMFKLDVEEWFDSVVKSMYENVKSRVRVNHQRIFSEVTVGIHQGSVLSCLF